MVRGTRGLGLAKHLELEIPARISGWIKLVCLFAVGAALIAALTSMRVPVVYQGTARVQPNWRLSGEVLTLDKVDLYASALGGRLKSPANLNAVIAELKLPYTASTLASNLTVTADPSQPERIDVTATDSNAARASQIANTVVAVYILQPHSNLDSIFVDDAAAPTNSPARPYIAFEALVAGLVGALTALGLFFLVGRVNDRHGRSLDRGGLLALRLIPASTRGRPRFGVALMVACGAALVAGAGLSGTRSDPALVLIAFAPLLPLVVVVSPLWRLGLLVVGGLVVFQSSQDLTFAKVTYFAIVGLIATVTVVNVYELRLTAAFAHLRWLLWADIGIVVLLVASLVVALEHGTGLIAWARDAAPYGLLALAILIAVDVSASSTSRSLVEFGLIACGLATALAYANYWLLQRNYGALPLDLRVLPSFLLPSALFAYSTSQVIAGRRRVMWGAASVAVGFLLFVSGSRATLLILAGPIVVAAFQGPLRANLTSRRLALALVPAAAAGVLTAGFLYVSSARPVPPPAGAVAAVSPGPAPNVTSVPPSSLAAPVATAPAWAQIAPTLQTKLIMGRFEKILGITHDPSFVERITVDRLAWDSFTHHPLLGMGPGYQYQWPTPGGQVKVSPYLDTGLSILTKFGLTAIPVIILLALGFAGVVRDKSLALPSRAALLGYCGIAIAWMLVESPLEDKGLGLGLALILVLTLSDRVRQIDAPERTVAIDEPDHRRSRRAVPERHSERAGVAVAVDGALTSHSIPSP